VGVDAFINELETVFLNQLDGSEVPTDLDVGDGKAVQRWVHTAFSEWFLQNRNELLAQKWAKRGWAEYNLEAVAAGDEDRMYQVKAEHVEEIEAWFNEETD
jgi:hypothetical protein